VTESREEEPDSSGLSGADVESPKVAAQPGGRVGRQTAGRAPGADHDQVDADTYLDARGGPGDREFHLRRVVARLPTRLSARRLAMLAEILTDDPP
jgi:hypothetical protein